MKLPKDWIELDGYPVSIMQDYHDGSDCVFAAFPDLNIGVHGADLDEALDLLLKKKQECIENMLASDQYVPAPYSSGCRFIHYSEVMSAESLRTKMRACGRIPYSMRVCNAFENEISAAWQRGEYSAMVEDLTQEDIDTLVKLGYRVDGSVVSWEWE